MKRHYHITPDPRKDEPSDAEIARFRDPKKLLYNYQKAVHRPKVPIYKDPKAFLALLMIILLAWVLSDRAERERSVSEPMTPAPAVTE